MVAQQKQYYEAKFRWFESGCLGSSFVGLVRSTDNESQPTAWNKSHQKQACCSVFQNGSYRVLAIIPSNRFSRQQESCFSQDLYSVLLRPWLTSLLPSPVSVDLQLVTRPRKS